MYDGKDASKCAMRGLRGEAYNRGDSANHKNKRNEVLTATAAEPEHWYGAKFEPVLPVLMKEIAAAAGED